MKKPYLLAVSLGLVLSGFLASAQDRPSAASDAQPLEDGTYHIRNLKFKDLLRPENANGANGTRIVLYSAQPWKCMTWRLRPAGASGFSLQNLFTSKTFAADAKKDQPQAAVTQIPLEVGTAPVWQFTRLEAGSYKISDAKSGKALTAVKAENDGEPRIVTESWRNEAEQKWELQKVDPKQLTM
jgi:hypothetical protein